MLPSLGILLPSTHCVSLRTSLLLVFPGALVRVPCVHGCSLLLWGSKASAPTHPGFICCCCHCWGARPLGNSRGGLVTSRRMLGVFLGCRGRRMTPDGFTKGRQLCHPGLSPSTLPWPRAHCLISQGLSFHFCKAKQMHRDDAVFHSGMQM